MSPSDENRGRIRLGPVGCAAGFAHACAEASAAGACSCLTQCNEPSAVEALTVIILLLALGLICRPAFLLLAALRLAAFCFLT